MLSTPGGFVYLFLSGLTKQLLVLYEQKQCYDYKLGRVTRLYIINSYYVKIRTPSERKDCGIGFHGSDNLLSNMQVSKLVTLKKIIAYI